MAARLHSWLAAQVRRVPAGLATGSVQSVLSTLAGLVPATNKISSHQSQQGDTGGGHQVSGRPGSCLLEADGEGVGQVNEANRTLWCIFSLRKKTIENSHHHPHL